jgi:peptidoglycan/xylan/chitin deacetylase (PgdA/CDA1 family)
MFVAILMVWAAAASPQRTVALTFDDLPGVAVPEHDRCDPPLMLRWNQKLLAALHTHRAPALGLVNTARSCAGLPAILNAWLDAGHDLGNHTYSHSDLHNTPLKEYEEDITRGETPLRELLRKRGKTLRYFRHPLLHTGRSEQVKESVEAFLRNHGYTVAPVTIDTEDWIFANAYSKALERGDAATAQRVAAAYIPYLDSVASFFEKRSIDVVGREIPQVILLHVNALNAHTLDRVLEMLERRGYRFLTVDEALRDPAYKLPDRYTGRMGISWIHRWGIGRGMEIVGEPREPEWIARLAK